MFWCDNLVFTYFQDSDLIYSFNERNLHELHFIEPIWDSYLNKNEKTSVKCMQGVIIGQNELLAESLEKFHFTLSNFTLFCSRNKLFQIIFTWLCKQI